MRAFIVIWWLKDRVKRVVSVLVGVHWRHWVHWMVGWSDVGGRLSLRDSSGLGACSFPGV